MIIQMNKHKKQITKQKYTKRKTNVYRNNNHDNHDNHYNKYHNNKKFNGGGNNVSKKRPHNNPNNNMNSNPNINSNPNSKKTKINTSKNILKTSGLIIRRNKQPPPPLVNLRANSFGSSDVMTIINGIKRMTEKDIIDIFSTFLPENLTNLKYINLFNIKDRIIIFVISIDIDSKTIPINMAFYKSTGTSRNNETIKGYWFLTIQYGLNDKLVKPEDEYLEESLYSKDFMTLEMKNNLKDYKRFINKQYAQVSYFLTKSEEIYPYLFTDIPQLQELNVTIFSDFVNKNNFEILTIESILLRESL